MCSSDLHTLSAAAQDTRLDWFNLAGDRQLITSSLFFLTTADYNRILFGPLGLGPTGWDGMFPVNRYLRLQACSRQLRPWGDVRTQTTVRALPPSTDQRYATIEFDWSMTVPASSNPAPVATAHATMAVVSMSGKPSGIPDVIAELPGATRTPPPVPPAAVEDESTASECTFGLDRCDIYAHVNTLSILQEATHARVQAGGHTAPTVIEAWFLRPIMPLVPVHLRIGPDLSTIDFYDSDRRCAAVKVSADSP